MRENRNLKRRSLIDKYMPTVKTIVLQYERKLPAYISIEDLVNAGTVGLLAAIENYDPKRSNTFGAYATIRIKGAIINELRQWDYLSRLSRKRVRELEQAYLNLGNQFQRDPTDEEVMAETGLNTEQYERTKKNSNIRFLNFEDEVCYERNLVEEIFLKQAMKPVKDALKRLSHKTRRTLEMFYFEEKSLREIAKELDVSESRISQLRKKAIEELQPIRKILEEQLYV